MMRIVADMSSRSLLPVHGEKVPEGRMKGGANLARPALPLIWLPPCRLPFPQWRRRAHAA